MPGRRRRGPGASSRTCLAARSPRFLVVCRGVGRLTAAGLLLGLGAARVLLEPLPAPRGAAMKWPGEAALVLLLARAPARRAPGCRCGRARRPGGPRVRRPPAPTACSGEALAERHLDPAAAPGRPPAVHSVTSGTPVLAWRPRRDPGAGGAALLGLALRPGRASGPGWGSRWRRCRGRGRRRLGGHHLAGHDEDGADAAVTRRRAANVHAELGAQQSRPRTGPDAGGGRGPARRCSRLACSASRPSIRARAPR